MSYENKGSMATTVTVSMEPDRSGNWVCDGTNDNVEIQAAIDHVEALGGGKIIIKKGTYDINATLFILDTQDIEFVGVGFDTKLVTDGDHCILSIGDRAGTYPAVRIYVGHLYFDGSAQTAFNPNPDPPTGVLIAINGLLAGGNSDRVEIDECFLYSSAGEAIYGYECGTTWVHNCQFDECCSGGVGGFSQCHVHSAKGPWMVTENRFTGGSGDAIRHAAIIGYNHISDVDSFTTAAITGEDVIIGNNIISPNGVAISSFADDCLIVGNIIRNGLADGIVVRSDDDRVIVDSNIIDYASWMGVRVGTGSGTIVSNNNIQHTGAGGIALEGSDDCVVSGNRIYWVSSDPGIELVRTDSDDPEDNLIIGNSIHTADGIGISLEYAKRTNIIGNRILACTTYGIGLDTDTDDTRVQGNFTSGNGSGCVLINNANCDDNDFSGGNTFLEAGFVDSGTGTIFQSQPFQFIKELNGTYLTSSPTGIEIDANTEGAILQGHIPQGTRQVMRLRVHGVALDAPIGAGGQMHLEFTFNSGVPNAAYNTAATSWTLANHDSEEADYIANDVITWVIVDADVGSELTALAAGNWFELILTHEAGADPDGATDAVFGSLALEYV